MFYISTGPSPCQQIYAVIICFTDLQAHPHVLIDLWSHPYVLQIYRPIPMFYRSTVWSHPYVFRSTGPSPCSIDGSINVSMVPSLCSKDLLYGPTYFTNLKAHPYVFQIYDVLQIYGPYMMRCELVVDLLLTRKVPFWEIASVVALMQVARIPLGTEFCLCISIILQ